MPPVTDNTRCFAIVLCSDYVFLQTSTVIYVWGQTLAQRCYTRLGSRAALTRNICVHVDTTLSRVRG